MAIKLVVTGEFAGFKHGDEITDTDLVREYAESHSDYVVKVEATDQPKPIPLSKMDAPEA